MDLLNSLMSEMDKGQTVDSRVQAMSREQLDQLRTDIQQHIDNNQLTPDTVRDEHLVHLRGLVQNAFGNVLRHYFAQTMEEYTSGRYQPSEQTGTTDTPPASSDAIGTGRRC